MTLLPTARLLEIIAGDVRAMQAAHEAEVAQLRREVCRAIAERDSARAERDEWRSRITQFLSVKDGEPPA